MVERLGLYQVCIEWALLILTAYCEAKVQRIEYMVKTSRRTILCTTAAESNHSFVSFRLVELNFPPNGWNSKEIGFMFSSRGLGPNL